MVTYLEEEVVFPGSGPSDSGAGPQMMRFPAAVVVLRDEFPAIDMEPSKEEVRKKYPNFSLSPSLNFLLVPFNS